MSDTSPPRDATSPAAPTPRRRFFQIRLRWLLLLPLLLGIPLAIGVGYHRSAKHQEWLVKALAEEGVACEGIPFGVEYKSFNAFPGERLPTQWEEWLATRLGHHYAYGIEVLLFNSPPKDVARLKVLLQDVHGARWVGGSYLTEDLFCEIDPRSLEFVDLDVPRGAGPSLTKRTFAHMANSSRLRVLHVNNANVGDEELKLLPPNAPWMELDVARTNSRGDFLRNIATDSLLDLKIYGCPLDIDDCRELCKFPRLRVLAMGGTGIDDECVRTLEFPELEVLSITYNPISDRVIEGLAERCPKLISVELGNTLVSDQAYSLLQAEFGRLIGGSP